MVRCALFVVAAFVLASCALASGIRESVVAGYCGVERGETWALIDAPADADRYLELIVDTDRARARYPEEEFWLSDGEGGVRYCRTSLRRGMRFSERNGSGCDDRLGRWWDFSVGDAGLTTDGLQERVCVL